MERRKEEKKKRRKEEKKKRRKEEKKKRRKEEKNERILTIICFSSHVVPKEEQRGNLLRDRSNIL
jgi:hypothetical protein